MGIWCNWLKATDRSKKMIICKHWREEDAEGNSAEFCKITSKKCACSGDEKECDISKELEESQDNCSGQL